MNNFSALNHNAQRVILIFYRDAHKVVGNSFGYFDLLDKEKRGEVLRRFITKKYSGTYSIIDDKIYFVLEIDNSPGFSLIDKIGNDNHTLFELTRSNILGAYKGEITYGGEIIFKIDDLNSSKKYDIRYSSENHFPEPQKEIKLSCKNYPIILVPDKIRKTIKNTIPQESINKFLKITPPLFQEVKIPVKPRPYRYVKTSKTKFNGSVIYVLVLIPLYIFFGYFTFMSIMDENYMIPIILIIAGISVFFEQMNKIETVTYNLKTQISNEEFSNLNIEHEKKQSKIKKKNIQLKKEYLLKKKEFDSKKLNVTVEESNEVYYKFLIPKLKAESKMESFKRGKSELMFLNLLIKTFGNQIKVDNILGNHLDSYYPDFTFVCKKTGLHIDVEIDEPYTLKDKKPIHYIGSNDNKRNKFFLEQNWCVIRFSEKQIVQQPELCIELIKSFLSAIHNKSENYEINLKKDKRWNYEEALVMSYNDSRNIY